MRAISILGLTLLAGCTGFNSPSGINKAQPETYYDYHLYNGNGQPLSESRTIEELSQFDVVLVGEWHTHPAIHSFQTRLLQQLHEESPDWALSMEQFSRDKQSTLDDYLAGNIGEQTLISKANGWPNYESDYRPLIEYAKAQQLDVIAANAPKPIVRCIGQKGLPWLDTLPANKREQVAINIDTSDTPYKEKFMASLHHGKPEDNINNYAAQVTWDETMAESITLYLNKESGSKVLHIAGKFHTEEGLGIAASIKRIRPETSIAVITPVETVSHDSPDYQLHVLTPPVRYVKKDNKIKAIHKIMERKKDNTCNL
ncbi:ChaN family lipoprotein [Vibrio hannami]|uniref:ChaN family lipoprotein n=1 Tax=Vibrio hannami TaxID=2717094 RepID=UPI00240F82B8|nr:ChaN family lipoprotein [Vibrio hannami]MDG3088679.1 ChaN family lipoprotein [Vibrio hannami]